MTITWQAKYKDGTVLGQFDEIRKPREISSEVIDRKQIESFFLLFRERIILTLHLDEGQRLIYRRRVALKPCGEQEVCHLVGWQATIRGENVQTIAYVFESGRIDLAGKFNEKSPWFYPLKFTDSEKAQGLG